MQKTKKSGVANFKGVFDLFDSNSSEHIERVKSLYESGDPVLSEKPSDYRTSYIAPTLPEIAVTAPATESEAKNTVSFSWKDTRFRDILLDAQLQHESGFNPKSASKTDTGEIIAEGIAQFTKGTWAGMINKGYIPRDASPYDVDHAIVAQFRLMNDLYNLPVVQEAKTEEERVLRMLAAYNSKPGLMKGRIRDAEAKGVSWESFFPDETKNYIKRIRATYKEWSSNVGYKPKFDRSKLTLNNK